MDVLSVISNVQLSDAKKRSDEGQVELEELQGARRKQDKEIEALNERIEELQAENNKVLRSKKKVQEEVRLKRLWILFVPHYDQVFNQGIFHLGIFPLDRRGFQYKHIVLSYPILPGK